MRGVDGVWTFAFRAGLAAVLAGGLAACSSVSGDADGGSGASSDSLATKLILGTPDPAPLTPAVDDSIKQYCPPVDILAGAASYRQYDTPGSTDPFAVRYQASVVDTARECSRLGVEAAIKVGMTGRVILGPKGAPGTVRVPLRIAVVDEQNRPLFSELRLIDVTVAPGQTQADFPHLEDNIVVPIPDNRFRGWRILVGYDGAGVPAAPRVSRRRGG